MTNEEKKKHCLGCEDDFYNGKNPYGIKECWLLDGAKLVMRKPVHIDQRPPWNQPAIERLSCYRQKGYIHVEPERTQ